ncbi:MAG: sigma-54-dependent Fis family transcriptional regulator, partial [Deltaproteobacteria bacterium]
MMTIGGLEGSSGFPLRRPRERNRMKNDDIMKNKHVMIVDDDRNICQLMERNFSVQGCRPVSFNTFDEAVAHVQEKRVDVLITDLNLEDPDPAKDGIALLKRVKEINRSIMVIILTGFGTIDSAVEAMHHGAFHYATKPVNLDEINLIVARALEHQKLNQENSQLRRSLRKKYKFENFVGDSEPMQQVFRMIEKVADTDTTVLITGESGTGKELVAQAIHLHSHRSDRHLIPVNCAAIPSELLESEFFGHVKGAFTNAIRD